MIDLSGTMLSSEHIDVLRLQEEANSLAKNIYLSDAYLAAEMKKASKNMFVDDAPGLRGESQTNFVTYREALRIRKEDLRMVVCKSR